MNNEASQKLQTAGGAEREARELSAQVLEILCTRTHKFSGPACQKMCGIQQGRIMELVLKFAARCANEARLEALEQLEPLIPKWRSPEYDKPYRGTSYAADELERAIRALKAAPAPLAPHGGQHEN